MCGIVAFSGKKDKVSFDESVFRRLALEQDSRGGHGVGLLANTFDENGNPGFSVIKRIDDYVKKSQDPNKGGHKDLSTFRKLFDLWELEREHRILGNFAAPYYIIGHARKASVGVHSMGNTHPHIIKREDGSLLVGVHNGTISASNIKELSNHVDVDVTGIESDSRALFTMMAQGDEIMRKTLASYNGDASLVWYDSNEPFKMFVWTAEDDSYRSAKKSQQRPLHLLKTVDGIFISSEWGPLDDVFLCKGFKDDANPSGYCTDVTKRFKTNAITTIEYGEISSVEDVERDPLTYVYNTVGNSTSRYYNSYSSNKKRKKGKGEENEDKTGVTSSPSKAAPYSPTYLQMYKNSGKLYIEGGLYYCNGKLLDCFSNWNANANKFEVTPVMITSKGERVMRDMRIPIVGVKYTYCGDRYGIPFTGSKNNLIQAYFYRGVLIKDREGYINILKHIKDNKKSAGLSYLDGALRKNAAMPIPTRLFSGSINAYNKFTTFYKFGKEYEETLSSSNKYSPTAFSNKMHFYQYAQYAAMFNSSGNIQEHVYPDRYSDIRMAYLLQIDKDPSGKSLVCAKCSRVCPTTVDCITCFSGEHSSDIASIMDLYGKIKENQCGHCFSETEELQDNGCCNSCNEHWEEDPDHIHQKDTKPAKKSKYHNLITAIRKDPSAKYVCTSCNETYLSDWKNGSCDECGSYDSVKPIPSRNKKKSSENTSKEKPDLEKYEEAFEQWGNRVKNEDSEKK